MCTIGLPIQNIVLANELSATEEVVTEEVEINGDKTIASEEAEQPTEEIQEEKEISEESTSAVAENAPLEQQTEEIAENKEEVKESNQPVEAEKAIEKDVKAVLPDKISVIFPDAVLAERIRSVLGKSSIDDVVTQAELDTIVILAASGTTDLSGIENLTRLVTLRLDDSSISDVSPLSNLTNLTYLNLYTNQISDISPLSNLTNLIYLNLANQKISARKVKWNDPLSVTNAIKDENGNLIAPSLISNQGAYTNPTITWTGLANASQTVDYSWSQSVTIGNATSNFYGKLELPVEKSAQLNVKDSTLMQGDTWNASDNFLDATDDAGNPVAFQDITVTGSVDTTQPDVYKADYSYDGVTSTATITVLETMPESWINFIVDGTKVRSIPGSLLSTPEWDLTTGLWAGWNPGTIKVPTDKLP
ncbi:bacterial Ig-like domain-containing protein, partial [Listeria innocua]|uniref:bacterial Ig-like domain-containing protein n=1 Tax=Listeria innocua TaxID=1642 RepID=UPI001627CCD8